MSQAIGSLLVPSGMVVLLVSAAVVALLLLKRRPLALLLFSTSALVCVVFGTSLTTQWLMGTLETEFPAAQIGEPPASVDTIIVLTGYAQSNSLRPTTGQVNRSSAFRLLEAARIAVRSKRLTVLISGGGEVPSIMKELLVQLGVPEARIAMETDSTNTFESAVNLRERLAGKTFYLVTSAGHMPRAMRVFRKQGLAPVPAPTDYLAPVVLSGWNLIPSAQSLAISDLAVHEYLAMLWYRMLGRL